MTWNAFWGMLLARNTNEHDPELVGMSGPMYPLDFWISE